MFKASVELIKENANLQSKINDLERKVTKLEWDLEKAKTLCKDERDMDKRKMELSIEEERNKLRKEMEKALIESDLKRVEAIAKLETYEKMDTKEERKVLQQMLDKAVTALGQKPMVIK